MAALRSHIASLNEWALAADVCPVTDFKLEEEIVSFAVSAGAATGRVNLSLEERSAYPRTGALAFADGSEELGDVDAVGHDRQLDETERIQSTPHQKARS